MKKFRIKITAAALLLALPLSLGACAGKDIGPAAAGEPAADGTMIPGYLSTAIELPDWLGYAMEMTIENGVLYLAGQMSEGYALGRYDLATGTWARIDFDRSGLKSTSENNGFPGYNISCLSAAEGVLWAMLEEYTGSGRDTYLLRFDPEKDAAARRVKISFEAGAGTESPDRIFTGLLAIGADRAVLSDFGGSYLIDGTAQLLQTLPNGPNFGTAARNNGRLMVSRFDREPYGSCPFDPETLRAGETKTDELLNGVSENGHWLYTGAEGLYQWDEETGTKELLFRWLDTALSYNDMEMYGLNGPIAVAEDSEGNFYRFGFASDYIVKTSPGMVKSKTVLTLATFGMGNNVQDAILRFNNSSPDYKIELRSYDGQTEEDQFAMDLTTGNAADIIDLSSLPDSAIDGGVFADLLPYIDSDPEICREDFIQPLLNSMIKDGHLYKLTANFTLITFEARAAQYPGREGWTIDYVKELIANRGENTPVFFWHRNRAALLDMLCWMATAEYIDWEDGSCRFESESFKQWLQFVRDIPYTDTYTEDAVLLHPDDSVEYGSAYFAKSFLQEDYVYAGFPGTSGNGSYFMDLGDESSGSSICYGISAASGHKDAAWEFLRILLKSNGGGGFSVLKDTFEQELEASICESSPREYDIFTREDAEKLRNLVYATEKTVHDEEELLNILKEGAEQYFSGQKTLDETAALIQSRAKIYVAEHR